jgi:hypothetical protein
MTLNVSDIDKFRAEDYDIIKKTLANQLQKHYDLLVDAVPAIKSINWYASQEDEMSFDVVEFKLVKNNGYIYDYHLYENQNEIDSDEFNPEEIQLIDEFQTYLRTLATLTTTLWGSRYFQLNSEQDPVPQFSAQHVKIK